MRDTCLSNCVDICVPIYVQSYMCDNMFFIYV